MDLLRPLSRLSRILWRAARQEVLRLPADQRGPVGREEARDQADLRLLSSHFIPGDPEAVGMPDIRLAVMLVEVLPGEDVLSIRLGIAGTSARFVEGVNHQRSVDLDRRVALAAVKEQPPAESTIGRAVGVVVHGIGPNGCHSAGHARLVFGSKRPLDWLLQVQLRAAGQERESGRGQQQV